MGQYTLKEKTITAHSQQSMSKKVCFVKLLKYFTIRQITYPYCSSAQPSRRNVRPMAPLKDKPTSAERQETKLTQRLQWWQFKHRKSKHFKQVRLKETYKKFKLNVGVVSQILFSMDNVVMEAFEVIQQPHCQKLQAN